MMLDAPPLNSSITPKREQILQGAMRVFLQAGYAGTSMDRVAAAAGVSKQTIYSHFQDKEGLFRALLEHMTIARFRPLIASEIASEIPPEGALKRWAADPEQVLRQVAAIYFTQVVGEDYLALLRLVIGESGRFPELAKLYTQTVVQQGRSLLCQYFNGHPELGITDTEVTAHIFMASLVSFVVLQEGLYGKETMPIAQERLVNGLIAMVLRQEGAADPVTFARD
jgi:AcrR family transcriptional regulator